MATTQNPPEAPRFFPRPPEHPDRQQESVEFNPVILAQLQDELARSRLREAFWISLIVHILIITTVLLGPKFVPKWANWGKGVHVKTAEELLAEKNMTFLELPSDEQKLTERPKSKFSSDKDRIATSRTQQLDKKALEMLRKAQRPGIQAPPTPQAQPSQQQQAQQQSPPAGGASQQAPPPTVANNNTSDFNYPAGQRKPNPFNTPMSPGASINEAARATAMGGGARGGGGDIGFGGGGGGRLGNIDILSDTQGVDFGPYLSRVLQAVRMNWYNLIPEVARPPLLERGQVKIEFAITKDGKVAGMRLIGPSGDVALDRAAWGGITASNPFPPLPNEFRGPYLALRFHFFYNPDKKDLE
jgi:TonB family protein